VSGLVAAALGVGAYIFWTSDTPGAGQGSSHAKLSNHRLTHVRAGQRLNQPQMLVDRKKMNLPDQLFLVVPAGGNTSANRKNGISENQVVALRRGETGEYRAVRLGFLDAAVEMRNGYLLFFERNEAERFVGSQGK
jgi:hypothetical protein